MRIMSGLFLILSSWPTVALAQVPPRPAHGASALEAHRGQVERHRHEMERLTLQADQRALEARNLEVRTGRTLDRIEAARQPPPAYADHAAPPVDVTGTAERHRRSREALTQIDDWLDRMPD